MQQALPRQPAYGDEEVIHMIDGVEQILKNFCSIYPTYTNSDAILYIMVGLVQRIVPFSSKSIES